MSTPFVDSPTYQAQGSTTAGVEPEPVGLGRLPDHNSNGFMKAGGSPGLSPAGGSDKALVAGSPPPPAPSDAFPQQKIWPTATIVLLHLTTYGAVLVAFNKLILDLYDGDSSKASLATGLFNAVPQTLQFLLNPFYGVLSDIGFGRRKFMIFSTGCLCVLLWIVALSPNLTAVFVAAIGRGATDSTFAIAAACITDVSPTQEAYVRNFGVVGAFIGLGVILGPGIGALLTLHDNHTLPFWVGGGFCVINVLFLVFVFKETRGVLPATQRKVNWGHANPFNNWRMLLTTRRMIYFVISSWLIEFTLGIVGIWFLFSEEMYGWSTAENGGFLAYFGLLGVVAQGAVLPKVSKKLNTNQLLYSSMFCAVVMYCAFSVAFVGWSLFIIVLLSAYGSLLMPVLRAELSKEVHKQQQGQLQGAYSSCLTTATVLGNLALSGVFSYFVSDSAFVYLPTAPFILCAILSILGALFLHLALRQTPQYADDSSDAAAEAASAQGVSDLNPNYLAGMNHPTNLPDSPNNAAGNAGNAGNGNGNGNGNAGSSAFATPDALTARQSMDPTGTQSALATARVSTVGIGIGIGAGVSPSAGSQPVHTERSPLMNAPASDAK